MSVAEFDFQVHPNRRDQTDVLGRRIAALDAEQRSSLLHFLCGYKPAAVQRAVQWLDDKPGVVA